MNRIIGPARFPLPKGGALKLDTPGQPFWDPEADAALFHAARREDRHVRQKRVHGTLPRHD